MASTSITVIDNRHQEAKVPVAIKVLDVNDNAPKLTDAYETTVCEKRPSNEVTLTKHVYLLGKREKLEKC